MKKIFYVAEAYIEDYNQGTDLILIKGRSGNIGGYSFEFNIYTEDLEIVAGPYNHERAYHESSWCGYEDVKTAIPASYQDLQKMPQIVTGYLIEGEFSVKSFS